MKKRVSILALVMLVGAPTFAAASGSPHRAQDGPRLAAYASDAAYRARRIHRNRRHRLRRHRSRPNILRHRLKRRFRHHLYHRGQRRLQRGRQYYYPRGRCYPRRLRNYPGYRYGY